MKFLRLFMDGFLTIKDEVTIDLSDIRFCAIVGPNGAGKSTMFAAITWALFGEVRVGRDKDSIVNDFREHTAVEVDLVAPNGHTYKIRRTRKWTASSALTVYLLNEDGEWIVKSDHRIDSAQEYITDVLGMTPEIYGSLMYVDQRFKDGTAFLNAAPADRKTLLMSLIPELDKWRTLSWHASEHSRETKARLNEATITRDNLDKAITSQKELLDKTEASLDEFDPLDELKVDSKKAAARLSRLSRKMEGQTEGLRELRIQLSAIVADRNSRNSAKESQRKMLARDAKEAENSVLLLDRHEKDLEDAQERLVEANSNLKKLRQAATRNEKKVSSAEVDLEEVIDRRERIFSKISVAESLVDEIESRLSAFKVQHEIGDDKDPTCILCESEITHARLSELETHAEGELKDAKKDLKSLEVKGEAIKKQVRRDQDSIDELRRTASDANDDARRQEFRIQRIEADIEELGKGIQNQKSIIDDPDFIRSEDILKKIESITDEDESEEESDLRDQIEDKVEESGLSEKIEQAEKDLHEINDELESVEQLEVLRKERRERLDDMRHDLRSVEKSVKEIGIEADDADEIRQACSDKGVPSMLLASILEDIEARQNDLLARLTSDRITRVEYKSEREGKSTTNTKSVLDVIVHTQSGWSRQYESLSGGERIRVMLSNLIAMVQVFNERAGGNLVSTLCLDEPFGAIDRDSIPIILDILNEALSDGIVDNVMIVTHESEVIEALPQRISVSSSGESTEYQISA